jgi:hypothetical protein
MKIRSVGSELFHSDRQTDRQTERQTDRQTDTTKLIVAFRYFANSLKCNGICFHFITDVRANFCLIHLIIIHFNTVLLPLTKSCDALIVLCNQVQRTESYSPSLYHNCPGMKSDLRTEPIIFK